MARRLNRARLLFEAAAAAKSAERCDLPGEIIKKFEVQFEGIGLPKKASSREEFLHNVGRISENMFSLYRHAINMKELSSILDINESNYPIDIYGYGDISQPLNERISNFKNGKIERLAKIFSLVAETVKTAQRSSKTSEYMQFLARDNFNVLPFLKSIGIFARERKIIFEEVPKEDIEIGKKVLELGRGTTDDSLRRLAKLALELHQMRNVEFGIDPEDAPDIDGVFHALLAFSNDSSRALRIVHEQYPEDCAEHEMLMDEIGESEYTWCSDPKTVRAYTMNLFRDYGILIYEENDLLVPMPFQKFFKFGTLEGFIISEPELLHKTGCRGVAMTNTEKGVMLLDSDDEDIVHHELQHLFDDLISVGGDSVSDEYRAYLSALVFSKNPQNICRRMIPEPEEVIAMAVLNVSSAHLKAQLRIKRQLIKAKVVAVLSHEVSDRVRDAAIRLFDKAYKKECGLTYDEILEPFKK